MTLPPRVHAEVRRYLGCGQLGKGFVHVQCTACKSSRLVAFSCKGRGWCPSCAAKRALETSTHLGEVLPQVGYRQWTLTLPRALRWMVARKPGLVRAVERRLVRAVWRWQRARARQLGCRGVLKGGAVGFLQLFGGALQLTPHLHVLLPEGQWAETGAWVVLPPPEDEEVESVLHRLLRQVRGLLSEVEETWPEEDLDVLRAQGALHESVPKKKARRLAVAMGFSLHSDTAVHAFDRVGLRRLCGDGARGPVSLERLSRLPDGHSRWQPKRGPALTLTAEAMVQRLVALVPPRGLHLTCFHGVFAPNAGLRAAVMLPSPPSPPTTAAATPPQKTRRPRLDWATALQRTFGIDVWTCHCGGKRIVRAVITRRATAQTILCSLGLAPAPTRASAQSPPQLHLPY